MIDTQCGNRLVFISDSSVVFVENITLNGKRKANKLFVHGMFLFQLSQPLVPYAAAVMVPLPPKISIEHVVPAEVLRGNTQCPGIAPIIKANMDKMTLTDYQIQELEAIFIKLQNNSITMDQAVLELRGGGFYEWATLAFIIYMLSLQQSNSFQNVPLPHMDPIGWANGKYSTGTFGSKPSSPPTALEMEKPSLMPQPVYSALPKSAKRQLADPLGRDAIIEVDGYPKLGLRFNQIGYKTPKHGGDHGLPVGNDGKTPKTEANAIALRDSLVDMANREGIVWYTNGQYQGGTPRGCDSVNLFDPTRNLIAVYQKQPDGSNLFLTTCGLTPLEVKHLKNSDGNFLTEKMINQQNAVSTNVQSSTNTNNDL